jgi:hypothetical protein
MNVIEKAPAVSDEALLSLRRTVSYHFRLTTLAVPVQVLVGGHTVDRNARTGTGKAPAIP